MRLITLVVLFLAAINSAAASESTHEAAARELLKVSRAADMVDTVYDAMTPQLEAMSEQFGIAAEQRPVFDRHMKRMIEVLREELNWEKMEPHMISAYVEVYSEEELMGLVDFYKSPLGQKFLDKMPEMMEATMKMTQEMMGGYYARLGELQAELASELRESTSDD